MNRGILGVTHGVIVMVLIVALVAVPGLCITSASFRPNRLRRQ